MRSTVRVIAPIVAVSGLLILASSQSSSARESPAVLVCPGIPEFQHYSVPRAPRPCPDGMVAVETFCIDEFEAPNVRGARPNVMASALDAERLCKGAGKRLCTEKEWETACSGRSGHRYPYGRAHESERCNDGKTWIRVDEPALNSWPSDRAKDEVERLWQGEESGARPGCVSEDGVYDMTGNVEEWVRRGSGHALKGCYWAACFGGPKPTCTWTNAVHGLTFRFYETGFRCCTDSRAAP